VYCVCMCVCVCVCVSLFVSRIGRAHAFFVTRYTSQEGDPLERFVLARVVPSHKDTTAEILARYVRRVCVCDLFQ